MPALTSMRGLRLGLLAGSAEWIREINKIRLPYNINVLTQYSAEFALRHFDRFREQTDQLIANRKEMHSALKHVPGIQAYSSEANFILIRCESLSAENVHAALKKAGVLVRLLHGGHELLDQCIRVNVSSVEEQQVFLSALRHIFDTGEVS